MTCVHHHRNDHHEPGAGGDRRSPGPAGRHALLGFAQMTLVGAVRGGLLAAALNRFADHPRRWFTRIAWR